MSPLRKWLSVFAAAAPLLLSAPYAGAIEPGARLPEIKVAKWISPAEAPAARTQDGPQLSILMLFDASSPDAAAFIQLLESLSARHAPSGTLASVRAVAKSASAELDSFASANGPFAIPVAADDNMKTFKAFSELETLLPYAVVADKGGRVLWSGHPTEIDSVIARMSDGSFSVESQRKISALRKELQFAIKAGLPEVVSNVSDKILAISPRDTIAIQAKLFAFENQGRNADAASFLAKACAANPKDDELRLQLLGLHLRQDNIAACNAAADKYAEDFKDSPEALLRLAAFLLDNSPFGSLPLELTLSSARAAVDGLKAGAAADKKAGAFETLAKALYYAGAIDHAILWQSKVCELRKGGRFEPPSKRVLEYYQRSEKLRSGLPSDASQGN